jgi:hypothetical protein
MVLLGDRESGRTTLAVELAKHHALKGPSICFDGFNLKWLGGAPGALRNSIPALSGERRDGNDDAARLLCWLARAPRHIGGSVLLVLDANGQQRALYDSVAIQIRERTASEEWKILVIDTVEHQGTWETIAQPAPGSTVTVSSIASLTVEQSLSCVQSLVDAARATIAPGFILTPDACLLAAHRANGNLGQLVRLIRGLVTWAREERALGVSSWDVWCARMESRVNDAPEAEVPSRIPRPEVWPTRPVMEILNRYRSSFGIPPRRQ